MNSTWVSNVEFIVLIGKEKGFRIDLVAVADRIFGPLILIWM